MSESRPYIQYHTRCNTPPICVFDKASPWLHDKLQQAVKPEDADEIAPRHALCCMNCRYPVTSIDSTLEINGQHFHQCTNPQGDTFEIRLFAAATCVRQGVATTDYTWFAGYAWQLALCSNCLLQLGWAYSRSADADFYGLIAERLTHSHS